MKVKLTVNLKTSDGILQAGKIFSGPVESFPPSVQSEIMAGSSIINILELDTVVIAPTPEIIEPIMGNTMAVVLEELPKRRRGKSSKKGAKP